MSMTLEELNLMLEPKLRNKICLNQSQVSELLGVSPSTLSNWRAEGVSLSYMKIGKGTKNRILYNKVKLLEFLNSAENNIKVV